MEIFFFSFLTEFCCSAVWWIDLRWERKCCPAFDGKEKARKKNWALGCQNVFHLLQFCLTELLGLPLCRNYCFTFSASFHKFFYFFPSFLYFLCILQFPREESPDPWGYPGISHLGGWGQNFCFAVETLNFRVFHLISALFLSTLRGILTSSLSQYYSYFSETL